MCQSCRGDNPGLSGLGVCEGSRSDSHSESDAYANSYHDGETDSNAYLHSCSEPYTYLYSSPNTHFFSGPYANSDN